MQRADSQAGRLTELLAPLRADPGTTAVFTDLDGTLAPIVMRPGDVVVPDETRRALTALADRYALVGCLSGRRSREASALIGVPGLAYVGNHGFERLMPGTSEPEPDPTLRGHEDQVAAFVARFDATELDALGLRLEDKGPIRSLHWRGAPDEAAAHERGREIAAEALGYGLVPHWGRKVLELRPPVAVNKGSALARLLEERRIERALYAGDDRTDVDAFRRLRGMRAAGDLETAICIGIESREAPRELSKEADVVIEGPEAFLSVLRLLNAP